MSRKLLIDADVLVYETAFAAQRTRYHYGRESFDSADEAKSFCSKHDLDYRALRKDEKITTTVEVLPESACRNILNQKLGAIQNATKSDNFTLFLSGDGNYREEFAVTKGYKANRKDQPKPEHYLHCRSLVLEHKQTVCAVGVEADDTIGIEATANPDSVICTIDKDLCMIPGRHYDWGKGIKFRVSAVDAIYWFCKQMLTGDSTDNIPGIPGIGDVKAEKLLAAARAAGVPGALWKVVLAEHNKGPFAFKTPTDTGKTHTGAPSDYINEQGTLLWIQRYPEERWNVDYFTKRYIA